LVEEIGLVVDAVIESTIRLHVGGETDADSTVVPFLRTLR